MSQEKEAQKKFYKTRENKEIKKGTALENKAKVLDDIEYKIGQSVQTMNMLNHNCKTSFVKPEFLKKAQRANPRLYDIGCYNDDLTLLLAPESDQTIRLAQESRLKLSDLIKPFDYKNLNNLYDLFVPQREKSAEQRYSSKSLENELSKRKTTSTSFEALQQHAINIELSLQQCQEQVKNDNAWKQKESNSFREFNVKYFEIQDLKAQLQDKGIAISELKKLIEKMKGKSVETKLEKSSVIRQLNAFKSQRQSILGKPATFSDSLTKKDFSKSKSVNINNVSNDISNPVTAQILPQNVNTAQKNTNVIVPGMYKEDRVMNDNSQRKKQQVEDHRRNFKFSNKKTFVIACNDSLNAKTSNVNFVCVTCGTCVLNDNHDMCVLHYINGVNSRTKQLIVVPISTKEPKQNVNQSVATLLKKPVVAESTKHKPRSTTRKQYEHVSKTCRWWYSKLTPPGYKWKPKSSKVNVKPNVSMPLGTKSRTTNILESITLRGSTLSNTPLSSNYFVACRDNSIHRRLWVLKAHDEKSQAFNYIRVLKGNDLLTSSRSIDLSSITLQDIYNPNPIYLMAKASSSQAWLWHRRLSHLNFDTINLLSKYDIVIGLLKLKFVKDHLCSYCELGKAKCKSFKTKTTSSSKRRLQILHMDLCGPMRVEGFNGKKYVLVIVDDYSRYTWTHFLRSKDKTPEVLIDFLKLFQRGLQAQVRTVRTDKGTNFLNKTLHAYFAQEAIATTCFTQNCSLVIPRHEKLLITSSMVENRYSTESRAYRVYNKRTRVIVETLHVNFNELPLMASDHVSFNPILQCLTMALEQDSLSPGPQSHENVPHAAAIVTTSNELDFLYSLITRRQLETDGEMCMFALTVSRTELKNIKESMANSAWIEATQEEIHQFEQLDLRDIVSRKELILKSHLHQSLDWKLSSYSLRAVYVNQPDGFVDPHHPGKVYHLNKALYKQAPRAWYDELSNFLVSKGFSKGSIDPTLFITKKGEDILLVQIYVNDIIFGSTNPKLSKKFEKIMHNKFEMSMMGELKLFLGIQLHESPRGIFINQAKYAQEILKKHGMTSCDSIGTPMATKPLDDDLSETPVDQTKYRSIFGELIYLIVSTSDIIHATCYSAHYQARPTEKHLMEVKRIFRYLKNTINMGLWYPKDTGFELTAFLDSDHAGCLNTHRTSGGIQLLGGDKLVNLSSKKQDYYGFHFDKLPMYCDSKAAIAILCNPVSHSHTRTEYRLADLFTKALPEDRFKYLIKRLGMRCLTQEELEVLTNETA
ncbi:retrovirus-related pol polyprotein from transposon TNT 1-94 [Tanacetum coccineum]